MIDFFSPASLPAPAGHYSPAVKAGSFVFISGQLPTGMADKSPYEQTMETLRKLLITAEAAGARLDQIVKTTAFITSSAHWPEVNRAYADFFGNHKPARSIVPVKELNHGLLVEVEAIAWVG